MFTKLNKYKQYVIASHIILFKKNAEIKWQRHGDIQYCQITLKWKYRNSREAVSSRASYCVFRLLLKFKLIWLQITMTAKVTYMQQASHYTILIITQKIFKWFQYFSFNLHLGKYFSEFKRRYIWIFFFPFLNSIPSIGLYSDIHPQSSLDFKTK